MVSVSLSLSLSLSLSVCVQGTFVGNNIEAQEYLPQRTHMLVLLLVLNFKHTLGRKVHEPANDMQLTFARV